MNVFFLMAVRTILAFVFTASGFNKLRTRVSGRYSMIGIFELGLVCFCVTGPMWIWSTVSAAFLGFLVCYRVKLEKSNAKKAADCNCGVPTFGKSFRQDTLKVGCIFAMALGCSFVTTAAWRKTSIYSIVAAIIAGIVVVTTNPARPTVVVQRTN
jgi:hypothetical protein